MFPSPRLRQRRAMSAGLLVVIAMMISGSGSLAGPVRATEFEFNARPWIELGHRINQFIPVTEFVTDLAGPPSIDYGADGRLTTLLVGSDWRERLAGIGERTDTMMVVSINPNTHQISLLSIPRDVGNVPIGPNQIFQPKINGLFKALNRVGTRETALEGMREAFEYTLQIEIDYVAYMRFDGFETLVEEVGGVPTNIIKDVYDSGLYDERTSRPPGAKFLIDTTEPLPLMLGKDAPLCGATEPPIDWSRLRECRRALLYVRSRHGPGNSDWVRGHRQQDFILDAIEHVTSQAASGFAYALGARARSMPVDFYTTLPMSSDADVLALYNLVKDIDPAQAFHVVLKPNVWAHDVEGTSKQELNIDVVRQMTREQFGPVN